MPRITAWAAVMACAVAGHGQAKPTVPSTYSETPHGWYVTMPDESLRVELCSDSVIHVVGTPRGITRAKTEKPWMLSDACPGEIAYPAGDRNALTMHTAAMSVTLSTEDGHLTFRDAHGNKLLEEANKVPRTYVPAVVNGAQTFQVKERFQPERTEAFYGLGQHQSGMFNYRGSSVQLAQNNTDVAIPLLVSSRGYAVMWNTAAMSLFDNRFPSELSLSATAGDAIDYYVIYGPEIDAIVHHYRELTGHVPMLPKWAYGYFQSKDRYTSQQEVLDVAHRYRAEHIPIDAIVQDWYWWKVEGDPIFTASFPDVPGELKTLHEEHVHAMLSVWGLFDTKSENFKAMDAAKMMVDDAHVYDASNPAARDYYWQHLAGPLFAQGWDAFWLDSSEPEEAYPHVGDAILEDKQLAIGNGAFYTNVYPLLHTSGVAAHWQKTNEQKRTFLLTRSAFLGQQRNGVTTWSGDVYSTYHDLQHQVPAGLNFALSGSPYWTTDIGGYFQPVERPPTDPAYQDLYARWFEFGAFCPIFRSHGHREHNEIWTYDRVEPILLKYDKLRYRLMPYIYSAAWQVSHADGTMQRPLVMDWRTDPKVWDIGDEFLFGSSLLVAPVTKDGVTSRSVYLPGDAGWYDFWTGEHLHGGTEVTARAPLDVLPLYVRAGAIVAMGPEIEYADEKPANDDAIELRVYRGADGDASLYDDTGDGQGYTHGQHAVIRVHWDDRAQRLHIGAHEGSYPGMPERMTFHVVWVGARHGVGEAVTAADAVVHYDGQAKDVAPATR